MTNWPLEILISGGQTGVDQAGLRAGRALGYETGGTAPQHFLTEAGHQPELLRPYGLVALPDGSYDQRTRCNVLDSHGTLLLGDLGGPGSFLTLRLCRTLHRPYRAIPRTSQVGSLVEERLMVHHWIIQREIRKLNIAGPRESKHPGVGLWAELVLMELLRKP